jgi:hypothetical protein
MFLRNVGIDLQVQTMLQARRPTLTIFILSRINLIQIYFKITLNINFLSLCGVKYFAFRHNIHIYKIRMPYGEVIFYLSI